MRQMWKRGKRISGVLVVEVKRNHFVTALIKKQNLPPLSLWQIKLAWLFFAVVSAQKINRAVTIHTLV